MSEKTVADLARAMEAIAPTRFAEPWDNVGLLLGDPDADLAGGVLLAIDLTPAVLAEAKASRVAAVVAYHPPIFKGVKSLVAGSVDTGVVFEAARSGLAIYSPHTALDVAAGGTNDVLADCIYLTERSPLKPNSTGDGELKLVTFIPTDKADAVVDRLFAAGAGHVGDYKEASFQSIGTGTFHGTSGTNPQYGQAGRRERVEELRVEMLVPRGREAAIVAALKAAHPYEEVAFDLIRRAEVAQGVGLGRIGDFEEPVPRAVLIGRLRREIGVSHVLVAGSDSGEVTRVAVCAGSCGGDMLDLAARRGAEFYVTGELRHHDALRATRLGMTAVCVLHSNSERCTLDRLAKRLADDLNVLVQVSEEDRDPFRVLGG